MGPHAGQLWPNLRLSLRFPTSVSLCFIPVSVSVWVSVSFSLHPCLSLSAPSSPQAFLSISLPSASPFPLHPSSLHRPPSSFLPSPLLASLWLWVCAAIFTPCLSLSPSLSLCLCGVRPPSSSHHVTSIPFCLPGLAVSACSLCTAEAEFCARLEKIKVL